MRILLALLPLLLGAAAAASAQSVAGRLSEEGTGSPIEGAVVVLLDDSGAQRAGTLTDARGRFSLFAPAPGRYRLRAERIGFRSTLSPVFRLEAGEAAERDLAASTEAIRLGGVEVEAQRRCVVRPADGVGAATLWEEARKALNAAALTQDQELVRFQLRTFERQLDPQFLRTREEETTYRTHVGSRPFESLPADDLAEGGYVRPDGGGFVYYAPDAHVLLSDAFLDTHCFRVRRGERETRGLIGLAFEPLRSRRVPDIEGVLWLDPRSSELRFVEFDYTRIGLDRDAAQGGRVEYERLPSGAWIVRRWWIRMPLLARNVALNRAQLVGVKEEGGEVEEVLGGIAAASPDRTLLLGTVFDSTAAAPLAGATVYVSGTSHTAVTDEAGFFRLEDAPEGEHTIGLLHPRLDSLGLSPTRTVSLRPGRTTTVDLAIPATPALLARSCAASAPAGTGLLTGTLSDEETGVTLPGAQVSLSWSDAAAGEVRQLTAPTDAFGRFRFCGAPVDVPVRVRALLLRRASAERELRLDGEEGTQLDLTLRLSTRPPENPDVRITFGPGAPASIRGRVLSRGGEPVAGAVVRLEGTDERRTSDAEGRFEISPIPADAYVLSVEHPSEGTARSVIELQAGANEVDVRLGG